MIEILSKIGFDWRMALANLVNFLIIFYLLKRFAFEPVRRILAERSAKIKEGLDNAQASETELTMAKQNAEAAMAQARQMAQQITAQAHEQAQAMLAKSQAATEDKAKRIVAEARELIAKEKRQMLADVTVKTVDIALQVSEKILRERLDEQKEKKLIEKILSN